MIIQPNKIKLKISGETGDVAKYGESFVIMCQINFYVQENLLIMCCFYYIIILTCLTSVSKETARASSPGSCQRKNKIKFEPYDDLVD